MTQRLEIVLDDVTLDDHDVPKGDNLATILGEIEKRLSQQGRVLMRITCDGQDISDLPPDDLERLPAKGKLVLDAVKTVDLVREGVADTATVLPELKETAARAAELLRQGRFNDGLKDMGTVVTQLDWLAKILNSLPMAYPEARGGAFEMPLRAASDQLLKVVDAMVMAQMQKDWIGLADSLQYELSECIDTVLSVLARLQGKVQ